MQFDEAEVHRDLKRRLAAVEMFNWALELRSNVGDSTPISISIHGGPIIKGPLAVITNPILEVGIIHCRALLEFLGLCLCVKDQKLGQLKKRKKTTDAGIEHFHNVNGPLTMLAPDVALNAYEGARDETEEALLRILTIANTQLAHITTTFLDDSENEKFVGIASRGIPKLMTRYFYDPLGLHPPNRSIAKKSR